VGYIPAPSLNDQRKALRLSNNQHTTMRHTAASLCLAILLACAFTEAWPTDRDPAGAFTQGGRETQVERVLHAFLTADVHKDWFLNRNEFEVVVAELDEFGSFVSRDRLYHSADQNDDGHIDFKELVDASQLVHRSLRVRREVVDTCTCTWTNGGKCQLRLNCHKLLPSN